MVPATTDSSPAACARRLSAAERRDAHLSIGVLRHRSSHCAAHACIFLMPPPPPAWRKRASPCTTAQQPSTTASQPRSLSRSAVTNSSSSSPFFCSPRRGQLNAGARAVEATTYVRRARGSSRNVEEVHVRANAVGAAQRAAHAVSALEQRLHHPAGQPPACHARQPGRKCVRASRVAVAVSMIAVPRAGAAPCAAGNEHARFLVRAARVVRHCSLSARGLCSVARSHFSKSPVGDTSRETVIPISDGFGAK
jgi:hypothetical protein